MIKNIQKFIKCSALVGLVFSFSSADGMQPDSEEQGRVRYVIAERPMLDYGYTPFPEDEELVAPDSKIWMEGRLTADTRYLGLICTGKCSFGNERDLSVELIPANAPSRLVALNEYGRIVFAEPQPTCTIKMPKGRDARVQLTLEKIFGKEESITNYFCLGVRGVGAKEYSHILYTADPSKASIYLDMSDTDLIELVPLISNQALSEGNGYVPVEINKQVAETGVPVPTKGDFDFGSVFRTNLKCSEIPWEKVGQIDCTEPVSSTSYVNGRFFAVSGNDIYTCSDGIDWTKHSDVLKDVNELDGGTKISHSPVVYSGDRYVVSTSNGTLATSLNGVDWTFAGEDLSSVFAKAGDIKELVNFGNKELLAVTDDGYLSRSVDGGTNWSLANDTLCSKLSANGNIGTFVSMAYGNDTLVAVTDKGYISISKDKGETWGNATLSLAFLTKNESKVGDLLFNEGKFYAVSSTAHFACSADGINWNDFGQKMSSESDIENVIFGNDKFYIISSTGKVCAKVGGNSEITPTIADTSSTISEIGGENP